MKIKLEVVLDIAPKSFSNTLLFIENLDYDFVGVESSSIRDFEVFLTEDELEDIDYSLPMGIRHNVNWLVCVTPSTRKNGYHSDTNAVRNYKDYNPLQVEWIEIGRSNSIIKLTHSDRTFNSVNFKKVK